MKCPMRFSRGGSCECLGKECMWYVAIVTGSSSTEACAVAAGVLSIQLDRVSVWFKQAGNEEDDE